MVPAVPFLNKTTDINACVCECLVSRTKPVPWRSNAWFVLLSSTVSYRTETPFNISISTETHKWEANLRGERGENVMKISICNTAQELRWPTASYQSNFIALMALIQCEIWKITQTVRFGFLQSWLKIFKFSSISVSLVKIDSHEWTYINHSFCK